MPNNSIRAVWIFGVVCTLVVVLLGYWLVIKNIHKPTEVIEEIVTEEVVEVVDDTSLENKTIGTSVEGRPIEVYTFGSGDRNILLVGGVHGGYEWNSILLAYEFIDYFTVHREAVPANLKINIIPNANPDGLFAWLGKSGRFTKEEALPLTENSGLGRFNANNVDLNRNFACKWQAESSWRGKTVSAGKEAFSEPEAKAIRDFVLANSPEAVVFWHSQANTVYASECENGIIPATLDIMNTYATAADYNSVASFDAYPVTGDAEGWLASIGIPAITVELQTHTTIEWDRNLAGVKAVLSYFE